MHDDMELDAGLLDLLEEIDQPVEDVQLCVGCNSPKPTGDFLQNQQGVMANCKDCRREYNRKIQDRRRQRYLKRKRSGNLPDTKICRRCNVEKPLDDFWKMSASEDGRQYYCKTCHTIQNNK